MKTSRVIVAVLCVSGMAFGQGSLTPPGAPAPTMKTLDEVDAAVEAVEARIDLATVAGNSTYHHYIAEPGSYYLSSNLEVSLVAGISIASEGVTLDLNGFEISRASGTGGYGIIIVAERDRVTIRNGSIVGFDYGIRSYYSPALAKACLFEKLAVAECISYGIYAGIASRLVDCRAHDNLGSGIYASSGSSLIGCTVYGNQGAYGIYAADGSSLHGCTACNNEGLGTFSYGIYAKNGSMVVECVASGNSNTNSPSTNSQGVGIYLVSGGTVKGCTVSGNTGDGIRVGNDCLVSGNACDGNGYNGDGAGIHATSGDNRIDGNNVTDNDRGIEAVSGNFVVRNSAAYNGSGSANYDVLGDNVGTIQTSPIGAGPWDNFEF